jgi:hypothetical protein
MDIQTLRGENAPHSGQAGGASGNASKQSHDSKPPLKWKRVLTALFYGRSLNRFEAERELHDHCLHTTVSTIQQKGVTISRRFEKVPGYQGIPTEVCRYWLPQESRQAASVILGITLDQLGGEIPAQAILAGFGAKSSGAAFHGLAGT